MNILYTHPIHFGSIIFVYQIPNIQTAESKGVNIQFKEI